MAVRLSEEFIESLPTPETARTFLARLCEEHPEVIPLCRAQPTVLAHLLVLAAHSSYLGDVLLAHPEYIPWFAAEDLDRVKSKEEVFADLARFAAMQADLEYPRILFRFKQRELLRIYARDCLRWATLAETMRELSDLADVILQHALWRSWQDLVDRYGRPEVADARGRLREAEFAIVALGKLGSQELNYASDIDLFYLYSGEGRTSSQQMTNKEFFTKLAARITRLISGVGPEGAVYRVDLRLRPRGRDGDLVVALDEAVTYYRAEARQWERQALIRARAAAGSEALVREFLARVSDVLYRAEPFAEILDDIRASKARLDQEKASPNGVDIKLGRGGIREIEFIVQALQLYHGGRDPWVRHPQILIGMQRLADKGWLTDQERAHLAEAYIFLRTLEHRLQMEHGVRTHVVPRDEEKLRPLARRMGYADGPELLRDLERHRQNVMAIFERVFHEKAPLWRARHGAAGARTEVSPEAWAEAVWRSLARAFPRSGVRWTEAKGPILEGVRRALNPRRAVANFSAWIAELATSPSAAQSARPSERIETVRALLAEASALLSFFGASDFLAQLLIRHPEQFWRLSSLPGGADRAWYAQRLRQELDEYGDEPQELTRAMNALRRAWAEELLRIGYQDVLGRMALRQVNALQTALAAASLEVAAELALRTLQRRYGAGDAPAVFTVLGLGRLGHNGVDYGSDLDLIVVYDDQVASPVRTLSAQEAYVHVVELVIHILSTITHEGSLYRVDLRLRPGGSASPLAQSRSAFRDYLRTKAATWERLAYLKAFPIVGDLDFGRSVHEELQALILHHAPKAPQTLALEVREMRDRIEREKARPTSRRDFKFGRGGMMDVYFATRYLQLKHRIPEPEERGTIPLIAHLYECGVLTPTQYERLEAGYTFLRLLDHALRVMKGRSLPALPTHRAMLEEMARWLGFSSPEDLEREHAEQRQRIRSAYEEIVR
ncbi:Bifunctional glutamine synthetase adenylyltransferase/adenylyl-removing enzyme [bacterium HR08]|nr:Bifunctional glutamine synthetase adenylyltransferase/adenylyl-removing enzyme [bacterium HR08]